jgi:ribosomal protein L37AE/L43A
MPYHFTQPCPTCGRHMRIAVELLGRKVECQHCEAQFVGGAEDDCLGTSSLERPLMERVEEILRRTSPTGISPALEVNETV